jgi:hypothetical protein
MAVVLRLTVATGPHKNQRFCFRDTARCQLGRAPDCFVHLAGTERDLPISRHHCELFLKPTRLTVQDLGSRNGTYLNGKAVDRLELPLPDPDGLPDAAPTLSRGDLLTIGGTTLKIDFVECPPKDLCCEKLVAWQDQETARKNCPMSCS